MKNVKKMIDEADESILDELIQACESKMSSKFKPKEEEPEVKDKEVAVLSVEGDSDSDEDELDEEKMRKLLEMYKSMKG